MISRITSLCLNVKEIIRGNVKFVEKIDEKNEGKMKVMKLNEEIEPRRLEKEKFRIKH